MFGIDDIILFPLLGSALGALSSKKDPMKGALMGGALGLGGAALPGLLGTGAASGAASTAAAGTAAAPQYGNLFVTGADSVTAAYPGATQAANYAATNPASGGAWWQSASKMAKDAQPIMQAAQFGMNMANRPQQQMQASPIMPNNSQGAQALTSLWQQANQYKEKLQQDQMARYQRRNLWGQ